jgi:hypothetical protein
MSVPRLTAIVSIAAVVAAVIAGLLVMGSPAEQRLLRLDEQRVMDLRRISTTATLRWDSGPTPPSAAHELVDGQSLSRLPVDPSSGEDYEYRVTGPRQFELCAAFARPSRSELEGDFWFHGAGRVCFEFHVPERVG